MHSFCHSLHLSGRAARLRSYRFDPVGSLLNHYDKIPSLRFLTVFVAILYYYATKTQNEISCGFKVAIDSRLYTLKFVVSYSYFVLLFIAGKGKWTFHRFESKLFFYFSYIFIKMREVQRYSELSFD